MPPESSPDSPPRRRRSPRSPGCGPAGSGWCPSRPPVPPWCRLPSPGCGAPIRGSACRWWRRSRRSRWRCCAAASARSRSPSAIRRPPVPSPRPRTARPGRRAPRPIWRPSSSAPAPTGPTWWPPRCWTTRWSACCPPGTGWPGAADRWSWPSWRRSSGSPAARSAGATWWSCARGPASSLGSTSPPTTTRRWSGWWRPGSGWRCCPDWHWSRCARTGWRRWRCTPPRERRRYGRWSR